MAKSEIGKAGTVWVGGEMWQAAAEDPEHPIPEGSRVRVVAVEGLLLTVKRAEASPSPQPSPIKGEGAANVPSPPAREG